MQFFYVAAAVVAVLWVGVRISLPAVNFEFDFDTNHGTFFILLDKYLWAARSMIAADLLLAYLRPHSVEAQVCLAGGVTGILFCLWLLTQYEAYVHSRYPRNSGPSASNYTPNKRATTMALGYATAVFMVMGLVLVLA